LVKKIANIRRKQIGTNIGQLSLFVFGEHEYAAIPARQYAARSEAYRSDRRSGRLAAPMYMRRRMA
jgi:hypothetical protein